jgi:CRP/FNR family transcriptional regulator, cyclic AMP receptor protein
MTSIGYVLGFIGAALTLASYMMKSMLPLRLTALAANVFFVAYGYLESALPSLLLYAAMIPINAKKAWDIRRMAQAIEHARSDSPVCEWLLPHMQRRQAKAGQTLWNKGDKADEMLYVESGRLNLMEYDESIGAGALVGEIGLFAPENRRTRTVVCATDCTLYALSAERMAQLYYQNPRLGFHVMRLVVARLLHDAELASQRRDASAPSGADSAPQSL